MEENFVSRSEFVRLVAEECGYHIYEVEDVHYAMMKVMKKLILENRDMNFLGIFRVRYRDSKERFFYSPYLGRNICSDGGKRVTIKLSKRLQTKVKDISLGRTTIDEVLAVPDDESSEDSNEF